MFELYAVGAILVLIGGIWVKMKWASRKAQIMEARAESAERIIKHDDAVQEVAQERQEERKDKIDKGVQDAVDNGFADFYDD